MYKYLHEVKLFYWLKTQFQDVDVRYYKVMTIDQVELV